MKKIISKEEFKDIRNNLEQKVVLCHGVFDLIHPGHIQHFQEAKSLGDILVVSVTAEKYVRKGPGRPYFNDQLRTESLAAIECIDYVLLSESYTVDDIVEVVKPTFYVKGQEYSKAEDDITGKITEEVNLVRKYGGDVYYTNGDVFSSTKLINQAFPVFSEELKEYLNEFKQQWTIECIQNYLNKMQDLRVLVIGDVIFDDYIYCKIQGLMSKNNGYSAKFIREEQYLGGSGAVARHLSAFSNRVTLMSVVGQESDLLEIIRCECKDKIKLELIESSKFSTIVKKRYVEPDDRRKELNKIFVINNLCDDRIMEKEILQQFENRLKEEVSKYDVVFLCDFGHGLIEEEVMSIIQKEAKLLVLNCQTNSSNYGLNLITKYKHTDYFSLDVKELRLAMGDSRKKEEDLLLELSERLDASGWLTRGSKGAISVKDGQISKSPAFVLDVLDTIGAGDAYFSLAGLAVAVQAPIEVGTFLGNVAGALATNIIGNKTSLNKVDTLKFITTLLKG